MTYFTLSRRRRGLATCLLVAMLIGCAPPQPTVEPIDIQGRVAEAEQMLEHDRPLSAARIYTELANALDAEDGVIWQLKAVELLFDHGYPEAGLQAHRTLETLPIPAELQLRKRVADAQAAIARQQGGMALRLLPQPQPDQEPILQARIHATRARALAQTDRPAEALSFWIRAQEFLHEIDAADAIERNREALWHLLDRMDSDTIDQIRSEADTAAERGWAELVRTYRQAHTGQVAVDRAFADWLERHPDHRAAATFAARLRDRVIDQLTYPSRIDVLLPLSGPLGDSARAIRDGMVSVYYDLPDYINRPQIVFHDVGPDGLTVAAAYARAVAADSGFIIGPLERSSVAEIAEIAESNPSLLTLNYLSEETSRSSNFYQFGLRPEDEARQAATAAIQNNRFNAIALTPSGEWGDRLRDAFSERLQELGGIVVAANHYNPDESDYGRAIQRLLNIDDSHARARLLRQTLGSGSIRTEPRTREDAEVIFLAAQPRQARLAMPQLNFHRIGDTPVYATSHVFNGKLDPDADWDMNGLFFTEIPWILNRLEDADDAAGDAAELGSPSQQPFPRLFALGADALELLPLLDQLRAHAGERHPGRTGRLSMNSRREIVRELDWARFTRGRPEVVPSPAVNFDGLLGTDIRERADGDD